MDVPDLSDVITSVIPGILYISGVKPANNPEIIKDYMIRRIIRLGDLEDFQNIYKVHKDVEYLDFVIEDSVKSHITDDMFKQCIDFINEAGGPVLVHCDCLSDGKTQYKHEKRSFRVEKEKRIHFSKFDIY